ncbi:capsular polysaccharide synthesis protein [Sarocladium implicatum]|nr:capsular polysaccharide synthesis protein [Sarocladium implicatum]
MESDYDALIPEGVYRVPLDLLDLRPDAEIDHDLLNPKPVTESEKNIWFFWHAGFAQMHGYTQRNIRAWHRRFSKQGWVIRVLDRNPSSPLNIANFLDVHDRSVFPPAFVDGRIGGDYAPQHTSDMVRWPLLLKYGGVYADVGVIQIGDVDRLWNETIANPASPYEVISYNMSGGVSRGLANYFFGSRKDNPLFARCHKLFLALWSADGGKTDTEGMHASPLLKGVPLMSGDGMSFTENGKTYGPEEISRLLSDYIVQGQALTLVIGLVDEADGWNGPQYAKDHIFAPDYMEGSQLINVMTAWNGPRQLELMSLKLPRVGETETADQAQAREIVQACLQKSFGFKLAHGLIIRVLGATLGSLWRDNPGSDDVPGTYAHWLRHATMYWNQKELPAAQKFEDAMPYRVGRLLEEV